MTHVYSTARRTERGRSQPRVLIGPAVGCRVSGKCAEGKRERERVSLATLWQTDTHTRAHKYRGAGSYTDSRGGTRLNRDGGRFVEGVRPRNKSIFPSERSRTRPSSGGDRWRRKRVARWPAMAPLLRRLSTAVSEEKFKPGGAMRVGRARGRCTRSKKKNRERERETRRGEREKVMGEGEDEGVGERTEERRRAQCAIQIHPEIITN